MIWRIIEPLFVVFLVVLLFSQVVLPIFIQKPFFWLFRKSERNLAKREEELSELKTEIEASEIAKEKKRLEEKLQASKK